MSTPTPRTDAAWSATFDGEQMSAGQTARALRECSQQLETELATITAERDQLRAEVERLSALGSWAHTCIHHTDEERKAWAACPCCAIARAERAEASLHAAKEECTDVRLKWHAVMGTCAAKEDSIMEADEELVCLRARAERAEAEVERLKTGGIVELAAINSSVLEYCKHWEARAERAEADAERYRLVTLRQDAELATERARLDHFLRWDPTFNSREDIYRDMQEAAK